MSEGSNLEQEKYGVCLSPYMGSETGSNLGLGGRNKRVEGVFWGKFKRKGISESDMRRADGFVNNGRMIAEFEG